MPVSVHVAAREELKQKLNVLLIELMFLPMFAGLLK